jgi:hypothetical protein
LKVNGAAGEPIGHSDGSMGISGSNVDVSSASNDIFSDTLLVGMSLPTKYGDWGGEQEVSLLSCRSLLNRYVVMHWSIKFLVFSIEIGATV